MSICSVYTWQSICLIQQQRCSLATGVSRDFFISHSTQHKDRLLPTRRTSIHVKVDLGDGEGGVLGGRREEGGREEGGGGGGGEETHVYNVL